MAQDFAAPAPTATSELTLPERAAFWGLPRFEPTQAQLAELKRLAMELNWDRYHCSPQYLKADKFEAMIKAAKAAHIALGPAAIPAPYGFLALNRLARDRKLSSGWNSTIDEKYFVLDQRTEHLGLSLLLQRKGNSTKALVKAGCHPALVLCRSWSGSDLPTPAGACASIVNASSTSSLDACSFLLGELASRCSDPSVLMAALADKARADFKGVWTSREGVANSAEATAIRRSHFAMAQLVKRKSLPDDLRETWVACVGKAAALVSNEPGPEGAAKTFSELEKKRMAALALMAARDDLEGFDALLPLCGLRDELDFGAGVPQGVQLGYVMGKYWTTRLTSVGGWLCAGRALDLGDNPWLCAGDGSPGQASSPNPFTWLATGAADAHQPHATAGAAERFGSFAASFARAALRDAETREPGRGRELCVEAFERSRKDFPALWSKAGSHAALAACESALMGVMLDQMRASDAQASAGPTRPARSRL